MVDSTLESKTRRLFFAVWPDERARAAITALVHRLEPDIQARWLPSGHWHLTLAFLGGVADERLPVALGCGDRVMSGAGELTLDRIEYWRRSDVLCLTPTRVPSALSELARSLTDVLRQAGFDLEKRPFRPHLTLARKLVRVPEEGARPEPIRWPFYAYSLVESVSAGRGVHYRVLRSWSLSVSDPAMPGDEPMK